MTVENLTLFWKIAPWFIWVSCCMHAFKHTHKNNEQILNAEDDLNMLCLGESGER